MAGGHGPGRPVQCTPIQVDDALYLCTSQNVVLSLDADTGEERWRFDPETATPPWGILGNCRGVTYYHIPDREKKEPCAERIFTGTTDARLIAIDKTTGQACSEFGGDGQIFVAGGHGRSQGVSLPRDFTAHHGERRRGRRRPGPGQSTNRRRFWRGPWLRSSDRLLLWAWDIGREGQTDIPARR